MDISVSPGHKDTCSPQFLHSNLISVDLGAGGRLISEKAITIDFVQLKNTAIVAYIHNLPLKKIALTLFFVLEHWSMLSIPK